MGLCLDSRNFEVIGVKAECSLAKLSTHCQEEEDASSTLKDFQFLKVKA